MRTSTMAHVAITTRASHGTFTEHWTTTYTQARTIVASYVTDNGLSRDGYGDAERLFRDGIPVGHYSITVL